MHYTAKYGKNYDTTDEFIQRYHNWKTVDNVIQTSPNNDFRIGHNKFSDWTADEKDLVLNKKLGVKLPLDFENLRTEEEFDMSFWDLPEFGGNNTSSSSSYEANDEYDLYNED